MSFLFYDFETTGSDPRCDRPIQFAALRTNDELEPIDSPLTLYATLSPEVLPHPQAVLVTGILPQTLASSGGRPEAEFAALIHAEMMQPGTCAVGFNSLRFDAELLRFMFWRNLRDPYAHEWKSGNSRWDVLDAARAFRLLRPEGIHWPTDEQGAPTLRLEALTKVNVIAHANAHDALGDVEATLAFARLMRAQSPKLFEYLLSLRKKAVVADFVDNPERASFVHVSGRISSTLGSASVFANLGQVQGINTQRLLWDLRFDPTEVLDDDMETLAARRFLRDADAQDNQHRLPIKLLHLNRAPVVVPNAILKEGDIVERMQLDLDAVQKNTRTMAQFKREVADKLHAVLAEQMAFASQDAECALYEGFMPNVDRYALDDFNRVFDQAMAAGGSAQDEPVTEALRKLMAQSWQDARLPELVFRFVARLRPDLLNEDERTQWQSWVDSRLNAAPDQRYMGFAGFFAAIDALMADAAYRDEATLALLTQLKAWGETRIRT
ncbi:exodeoxyribonuclease I [Halothiobacillus neapolitanus]|uniref:Exodeoxyribonuclease I n=1 Tax=Halothiobacillus neapolitanus (strain ATCC 23641 / DSM 15147 / CIP 104769 / NCIMB 8539 / c2) TaxID=555778 RepID=D0KZN4_HALNC|nr:exodeoxyribonuclease I [Halothiobacillus neapolitanus]ACX95907.1 Exodeoxyribonuclease I [Halothiobacillus neapolitanus c2]TDN66218.1 exodeoxyribonuclease I subunit C [Halothiobacillus neapolitanus]